MLVDDELIDRIYQAVVEPSTWREIVRDICRAFDAHSGVLALSDNETELSSVSISHGVFEDPAVVAEYFAHFRAMDIAVPAFARNPTGKVAATSRLFASRHLARSEFYNDFFHRLGLIDSIGSNVLRDERGIALICLQRAEGAGEFEEKDIAAAERLAPHIRRALQLHRAFAPHRRAAVAFAETLERVTVGVALLDDAGRVWHSNAIAREIFGRADGLIVSAAGELSATDRNARDRIARLVGSVLVRGAQHSGGRVVVPRRDGKTPYALLVTPAPVETLSVFDAPGRSGAMVLLSDPDRFRRDGLASSMSSYRLTGAELALLAALIAGQSLRDYCDERGISINTGKFHLRSLFAKTETRGQADLVRAAFIAMRGP